MLFPSTMSVNAPALDGSLVVAERAVDALDERVDHLLRVAHQEDQMDIETGERFELARAQREVRAVDDVARARGPRDRAVQGFGHRAPARAQAGAHAGLARAQDLHGGAVFGNSALPLGDPRRRIPDGNLGV